MKPEPLNLGRRKRRIFLLLVLMIVLVACICPVDSFTRTITTGQPAEAKLVGVYVLIRQTLTNEGLSFLNGRQAWIDLEPNGICQFHNFPVWQSTSSGEYVLERFLSVKGTWRVTDLRAASASGNSGKPAWGISFSGMILPANLAGSHAPFGLMFIFGDPVSGKFMLFETILNQSGSV